MYTIFCRGICIDKQGLQASLAPIEAQATMHTSLCVLRANRRVPWAPQTTGWAQQTIRHYNKFSHQPYKVFGVHNRASVCAVNIVMMGMLALWDQHVRTAIVVEAVLEMLSYRRGINSENVA